MKVNSHHSIELARGLGNIKFGLTTQDVQRSLGAPDEAETLDPGTDSAVMWYYADQKLQIVFQKSTTDEAMRLIQITTGHPRATLWGARIIGRPENAVLALFKAHGHEGVIKCDKSVGAQKYKSFRLESLRVTLDFSWWSASAILWGVVASKR